ncbi:YheC/YheD family protein [Alicyclobacillus ferrooxydans]|uniref:ATP-grasp domain-containing protein n=1 Tax=Alicyclobacillus ferrooxydans TaxID=471514 RepID=A0A0P9EV56_9BACL|nr:YheC/YheD family protein [Alicyclobacillus ferrooxydans]KPV42870.1 hypothetical protein AN477_15145 [Alicyclobacillus ferrooxydans]
MKRDLKYVGIMVFNRRQQKRVLQTYRKVAPKGIKIFTFTPSSINWVTKKISGLHFANKQFLTDWFRFPDVVYNRCYGADRRLLQRIEKVIGRNRCFNHVNHFDKQFTYDVLCQTELNKHLPRTVPYNQANLDTLLTEYGTLYVKPLLGNRGRGVYRVNKTETGEVHISEHYFAPHLICREDHSWEGEIKKLTQSKQYVVQQGIPFMQVGEKNFDIRVLLQKDRSGAWGVTNVTSRTAYSGCFNTSVCERVTTGEERLNSLFSASDTQVLLSSLSEISWKTAALLEQNGKCHLGELSVDLALDHNRKLWIIEVNGNPQRTMYKELENYQDVYRNPIHYAQFLMSHR